MGPGHTSEEFGGPRAICCADRGFVAPAEEHATDESVGARDIAHFEGPQTWPVEAALFALRCYKAYLSVLFAGSCRFEPTCSRFAYDAIERFGLARGVWLGMKRLLRCHPLSRKFGYDPVPEKWEKMPSEINAVAPKEVHS
jgi:putative membrane protein insertion efficiency factor